MDRQILEERVKGSFETQKLLTEKEGIFCEPASAISLADVMRDVRSGKMPKGSKIAWQIKSQIKGQALHFTSLSFAQINTN